MALSLSKTGLNRDSAFNFSCSRCLACCRFKKIQLNPYEIARMADNRGISTSEFIARYTTTGGTILRSNQDGSCVFLNIEGCSVHSDRPLVCRLYPLGRQVDSLGVEIFSQIEFEETCKGVFHENGTIEQYLAEQGAAPFMRAADLYLDLLWRLLDLLNEQRLEPSQAETILETVEAVAADSAGEHDLSWLDMDRAVAEYCRLSGIPVPKGIEEKMGIHIKAVREWAA
ncbi:MAG: YkgJ family cysteine cluster protein [Syntrophobacteraceae bacterium]